MSSSLIQSQPSLSSPPPEPSPRPVHGLRLAGAAGLLSVLAMLASFAVLPTDSGGQDAAAIAARYADGSPGYLRATVLQWLSIALLSLFLAGLCTALWNRRGSFPAVAAGIGGTLLLGSQLTGYALIATLATGTAARADASTIMALYDLSAVLFAAANVGLAVLCGATGMALLRSGPRILGAASIALAVLALLTLSAPTQAGTAGIHGDLGFAVLILQLLWTATTSGWLLKRR